MLAALSWQLWHVRRQSLAALAESSRQLAAEREKTLQTQHEKDALARENKSKSEMLATLSRDIRGHLNGIMGSADLHIAVLDDLAAARVAASALLSRLGFEHDTTDTVAEAAELLHDALDESESTQLVLLLDESVAAEHGAELARLLAQDPALSSTRVVLLSRDPESVPPTGHGFPLTAILRKPLLRPEALLEALQAKPGTDAPRPSSSRAPFLAGADHTTRPRPHVLVVDDDNISRSVSSQLLALLGCQVEVAESGPAAITHAGTQAFDLIFMDCQMPGMDGYEATQKILAAAGGKAPPIVALTANTSARDRERCLAAGMSDFIAKPVHKTDLARTLRRWARPETVRTK